MMTLTVTYNQSEDYEKLLVFDTEREIIKKIMCKNR